MKTSRAIVCACIALTMMTSANLARADFSLTILHHNDGESKFFSETIDGDLYGGIANFATLMGDLRGTAGTDGVLTISAGDNFLAGAELNASFQTFNDADPANDKFFDSIALGKIDYDAFVLGNHEFDFGPSVLADFVNGFTNPNPAPFLSANLDFSSEPALSGLTTGPNPRIAKSTVVNTGGMNIGIIGATTELLASISSPGPNIGINDIATAVNAEALSLKTDGVQKIILASHLQDIDNERSLIGSLQNVDIVVGGGGDELLTTTGSTLIPGDSSAGTYAETFADFDGNLVPLVTTAGGYKYIGKLVVTFDDDGNLVSIDEANSGPVRVASGSQTDAVLPDVGVQSMVVDPVSVSVNELGQNTIGTTDVQFNGIKAVIRNSNGDTPENNLGNLVADGLKFTALTTAANEDLDGDVDAFKTVGLQNGGGLRNDDIRPPLIPIATLPDGDDKDNRFEADKIANGGNGNGIADELTELDTFQINAFSNFVVLIPNVSTQRLLDVVEHSLSNSWAHYSGLIIEYDPDAADGSKVSRIILTGGDDDPSNDMVIVENGAPVSGAPDDLSIATIDFLARGGSNFPLGDLDRLPFSDAKTYQQSLLEYISDPAGLNGEVLAADFPFIFEGDRFRIIPEPTSLVLIGIGGLTLLRRRRAA